MAKKQTNKQTNIIQLGKSRWMIVGMCRGVEIYEINEKTIFTYLKRFIQNHPEGIP